jgi:lysophospholipase L1-like esterase
MIICYFGDSITLGYGDPAGLGWPGRVSGALSTGGDDVTSYNLGVRQDTTPKIKARWRAEADLRTIEGMDFKLVFSFGVADMANDVPEADTLEAARTMLTEAMDVADVLVVGPTPVLNEAKCARVAELSEAIGALCEDLAVPFIPTLTPMLEDPVYPVALADGDSAHPTASGYAALARHILNTKEANEFFGLK